MYDEHELAVLTRDVPEDGLIAGDVGTVVGACGSRGYEVEFMIGDGRTVAVTTPEESDIRLRDAREILHVRGVPVRP